METITKLIKLQPRLEVYADMTDRALERTALDHKRETAELAAELERLVELKIQLVNLAVICREVDNALDDGERDIINAAIRGATFAEMGDALGISRSAAARRADKVKEKCARLLGRYDMDRYADLLKRLPLNS